MKNLLFFWLLSISVFGQTKIQLGSGGPSAANRKVLGSGGPVATNKIVLIRGVSLSYVLSVSATTSAGVYSGNNLVRTLWSNLPKPAGIYSVANVWDGKDDAGVLIADGNYTIRVLSNNVTYTWEGTVGNSSTALYGATKHRQSGSAFADMRIVGTKAIYVTEYNEGQPAEYSFSTADPQTRVLLYPNYPLGNTGLISYRMCTDGTNVYFGGPTSALQDVTTYSFIHAIKVTDYSDVSFSSGTAINHSLTLPYASGIDVVDANRHTIDGMAVQKTGNYLFVSRAKLNSIHVLNKTTGASVQSFTMSYPLYMDTDNSGNLWIVNSTNKLDRILKKYSVNSDGTLGSVLLTISVTKPTSVNVSPDGTKIAVCDESTQQVKFYNNSTGALLSTLGSSGGYASTAVVDDYRFMFRSGKDYGAPEYFDATALVPGSTYVAFDPTDNSYWVNDPGNSRIQHFNSSGTFIERITTEGYNYSVSINATDPTRFYINYKEFQIDYSKPLLSNNDSWKLIRNFAYPITPTTDNQYKRLQGVTTLSNNKTYALNGRGDNSADVVELLDAGLRFTGQQVPFGSVMQKDGSLWKYTASQTGGIKSATWSKQLLTGFDGSNNPIWGTSTTLATVANTDAKSPINDGANFRVQQNTSTGDIIYFNEEKSGGYHLASITPATSQFRWRTAPESYTAYQGEFPDDGVFDIGNGVGNAGGNVQVLERNIFHSYKGEFWKASQTNKYNHFYDNGLFIGQFGTTGPTAIQYGEGGPMMAGNPTTLATVKVGSDYYLYHNDESYQGGALRWKIGNLSSIQEQSIPITKTGVPVLTPPVLEYTDLMAGLPRIATITTNVGSWSFTPALSSTYSVKTGLTTYKATENSVRIITNTNTYDTYCALGSVNSSTWTITGQLGYPDNGEHNGSIINVLDNTGKVLLQINRLYSYPTINLTANNTTLVTGNQTLLQATIGHLVPISIRSDGSQIHVIYGTYPELVLSKFNSSASLNQPARINFHSETDGSTPHTVDVANLRLYTN